MAAPKRPLYFNQRENKISTIYIFGILAPCSVKTTIPQSEKITVSINSGFSYHAVFKLPSDLFWIFTPDLYQVDPLLDLVQLAFHVRQLRLKIHGTLELAELGHHLGIVLLEGGERKGSNTIQYNICLL